ncbi:MAG: hypothetical protein RIR96_1602, partial [Bacteroidota bacterium]
MKNRIAILLLMFFSLSFTSCFKDQCG